MDHMGGDEINLIEVKKINEDKIQNYGWPITSAGEHYGGRIDDSNKVMIMKNIHYINRIVNIVLLNL